MRHGHRSTIATMPPMRPGADPGTPEGGGSTVEPAARGTERYRHVVVVAAGDVGPRPALDAAWPGWAAGVDQVIAADGGFARAEVLGLAPDLLIGDLDSIDATLVDGVLGAGLIVRRAKADKDESDTELAVLEAVRMGATRVTVLGALGGRRLDHALANIWLLALPALGALEVTLLDVDARLSLVTAPDAGGPVIRRLDGPIGATISLLPLGGDVLGVTTDGMRYPLRNEALTVGPARGLSNVRTATRASVTVRSGRLLVVEPAPAASGLSSGA